ncbi:hypothetical protein HYQ45_006528 [Verticillium longisporum]|uniref:NADH:ubiquinone oxidoreductase intermediate-associated protein 30 domain-containing protein n=1 Tax=Verticillium longisporum TaxID=100787 RepID=A0A0G4LG00_VERLO|nr:hypothetical protein HYQ44_009157 [Verticillium longisporum]KAG7135716.1 hypothetical protein HYQ45_006528 [Verticillium longisporum]CRK20972.1 hypothetical protein BN1708_003338 [Verticillium longisporum]
MADRQVSFLFGGDQSWKSSAWTASDDRVRGGRSQSYLRCQNVGPAEFHGHLDITALGGAGFASQRTVGSLDLDLTSYEGLSISINHSDGKKYTLTLKDEILPRRPDGREQSTVSWEFDFVHPDSGELFIRWADFKPTYRGKPKPDTPPLDLAHVQRISFMMRSFFGEQQGDFELAINHVAAFSTRSSSRSLSLSSSITSVEVPDLDKAHDRGKYTQDGHREASWKNWLCGWAR